MIYLEKVVSTLGPWQFYNLMTVSFLWISISMHHSSMPFLAPGTDHWCKAPAHLKGVPQSTWRNHSIPKGDVNSKCSAFALNYENITESEFNEAMEDYFYGVQNPLIETCSAWEHETSTWIRTIVHDFDLVCERSMFISTSSAVYQVGVLIGLLVFGQLTDRFGRKKIAVGTVFVWSLASLAVTFSPNIYAFILFRFAVAFVDTACLCAMFVTCQESLSPKMRNTLGISSAVFYSLGITMMTGLAYAFRDWRYIQLFATIPVAVSSVLIIRSIESPEWLISVGKIDEAIENLQKVAYMNGIKLPEAEKIKAEILLQRNNTQSNTVTKKSSMLDLIKTKNIRIRTVAGLFVSFTASSAYYSFTFNMEALGGDLFVNMLCSGILEIVGLLALVFVAYKYGKRIPICGCMFIASFLLGISVFIPDSFQLFKIGVCLLGKTFFYLISMVILTYVSEYTPTVLRSLGIASTSMTGVLGSSAAPYLRELGICTAAFVPIVIYSVLGLVSGFMALLLPETLNRELPRTIEEAENFKRREIEPTKVDLLDEKHMLKISQV